MATPNHVPRADGEGKLGTTAKRWGEINTYLIKGETQRRQLSADHNTSSQTLGDVTGMADFALKAGGTYRFRFRLMVTTNATSVGILCSVNASAAVTSIDFVEKHPTSATADTYRRFTVLQSNNDVPATGPGATMREYMIEGIVVAASDCTFALQSRSETATETTVKAGSYGEVERIA